jgi:hypothetical protein
MMTSQTDDDFKMMNSNEDDDFKLTCSDNALKILCNMNFSAWHWSWLHLHAILDALFA